MAPIWGGGPFVDPFNPPGGIFKEPVLICLNSWWPGILLDTPALLSIVRCIDVAIAGLRWGDLLFRVSCACVEEDEGSPWVDIEAYRGEIKINFGRLIKPRSSAI
jgi:hypothetical protein